MNVLAITCLSLFGLPVQAEGPIVALPLPTPVEVEAAAGLPRPATNTHPTEWANPGSLGPTGLTAQRCMTRLEYRVLVVEAGSPAHGRVLPKDIILGVNGQVFQPEDYSAEHSSVARYNRFMEPNVALGTALEYAAAKQHGRLVLTVRRGEQKGTVALQLPSRRGFSDTYPWNCSKSEQVAEEIAARFARQRLPYKNDLYATAWYGLFLLNHDPVAYRGTIDRIVKLVLLALPKVRSGSPIRGYGGGTWVWHTSLYGMFLAEYALVTHQQDRMRPHLNRLVALLYDVRMVGNLWGHAKWHNYGSTAGGFMPASCQAALALLCLKQAGAAIHDSALAMVMDSLSTSIDRDTGFVGYTSPDNGSARQPLNWSAILAGTSQLGKESLMRQGAVQLAMLLDGRTDQARAASHFMERMTLSHATHGITPDWGFLDASRALASTNPAACRRLLDTVRYRLNLCLRWDGGLQIVPYRNRRGEEYGVDTFGANRYAPAMWGLILSMPQKRLYLLSRIAEPNTVVTLPSSSTRPMPDSLSVRHLTCGGGKAYYAAPDGLKEWGVYEYDFNKAAARLLRGALPRPPHELFLWGKQLYFSVPGGSLWVWDGKGARQLVHSGRGGSKAAGQFTPLNGFLYFVSPPGSRRGRGGELWKTNGTMEGTTRVKDGLWMLLGGSGAWQSDVGHAQSLQAALGKLFFVTCETDARGRPSYGTFALWASDGTGHGAIKLATKRLEVMAVDNGNAPRGSFLGMPFRGKLYFNVDGRLWESDGTASGTRESALGIQFPNNLSLFRGQLLLSGRRTTRRGRNAGLELILTRGQPEQTRSFSPGVRELRQITAVGGDRFFFVANDGRRGDELWASDGTPAHTRLVRELNPGAYGGIIDNLISLRGMLYFTASDETHGSELWRSDGGPASTRVADLLPGPAGSLPDQLRVADGKLYFYTTAIAKGHQLWRHDPAHPTWDFRSYKPPSLK